MTENTEIISRVPLDNSQKRKVLGRVLLHGIFYRYQISIGGQYAADLVLTYLSRKYVRSLCSV